MSLSKGGSEGSGGGLVFLSPINTEAHGTRFARRVPEGTEGAEERDAKCGIVHELYYSEVTGVISAVKIVDKSIGEELQVFMKDGEETYVISSPFSNEVGKAFIVRMRNMNESEAITLGLFSTEQNGRLRRILYAKYGDEKVENAFKKDNEAGLSFPQPKKEEGRGGKVTWDWKEHDDGLYDECNKQAIEKGWATEEGFTKSAFSSAEGGEAADDENVPF